MCRKGRIDENESYRMLSTAMISRARRHSTVTRSSNVKRNEMPQPPPLSKKWRDVSMDDPAKRATGQLGEYGTMNRTGERPFSDIVGDIVTHAQEIVRSEVRLAKTELKEE